ncbi:16S rRNA (cytosine(1402)-N(4))-methyltransferase RsmH [Candidatus Peregrinibacteria bacterium]|nr:16S rRNA (cytosine(1402)-N(4))-methyltransferase RsmH [Candidatus Peregrinibacteria bacterium]
MHVPVLLEKAVEMLNIRAGSVVVDATVGLGGHARKILEKIGEKGVLIALDADMKNLEVAREYLEKYSKQIRFFQDNFENLEQRVQEAGYSKVSAILFDLGLSSPQVDDSERGFSFLREGPLDMRYDRSSGYSASDIVNRFHERDLADIFWKYGEERHSRRIAREIVYRRKEKPFVTTLDLAGFVKYLVRSPFHIHPATRVFQALRIAVNRELETLGRALAVGIDLLAPSGRIVVISYHSLEDRIVKNMFRTESKDCICPPEILECQCGHKAGLRIITKKPIIPDEQEISSNPRSRSAKMRGAEKVTE